MSIFEKSQFMHYLKSRVKWHFHDSFCNNASSEQNVFMNSLQTCNSVTVYFMKNSFSDVSKKWILPNMIRAVLAGSGSYQIFIGREPQHFIFGKILLLLTSENEFFMK